MKLQSIVMPLSEFDHADKGDALYGWFLIRLCSVLFCAFNLKIDIIMICFRRHFPFIENIYIISKKILMVPETFIIMDF